MLIKLPELFIEIRCNNEIIVPYRKSHSWVNNYYFALLNQLTGYPLSSGDSNRIVDTDNTARSISTTLLLEQATSPSDVPAATTTRGIVVGTGTTAESASDYALAILIAEGTGAGQLSYQASSISYGGVAPTKTRTITRTFVNNSGGTIAVAEVGIINNLYYSYSSDGNFLYARDVLGVPINVTDNSTLQVQYSISYTYPS